MTQKEYQKIKEVLKKYYNRTEGTTSLIARHIVDGIIQDIAEALEKDRKFEIGEFLDFIKNGD